MAWKKTDDIYYSEIASAIRAKNGTNNTYRPSQMAEAINVLPEIVDEDAALVLIDWEGTLLRSYTREEVMALTELPNPTMLPNYAYADHEWLVFQEWNWSLAGIKSFCSKYGYCPLYVGAIYDTTGHLNHIDYEKGIAKFGTQGSDNMPMFIQNRIFHFSLCNGYNANYISAFGNSAYTLQSFNVPSDFPRNKIKFTNAFHLRYLSLPENSTNMAASYNFTSDYGLNYLPIPDGITAYGINFIGTYQIKGFNIPDTVTTLESYSMINNYNLGKIEIPKNVSTIGQKAFLNNYTLKTIVLKSKPSLSNVDAFSGGATTGNFSRTFYVPQANLSWFSTETNWADIYSQYQFVTIEDNIDYLEQLGFNVDEYKEATP